MLNKKENREEKTIKGFKSVEFMKKVRDKISDDIKDLNFEQIIKYFEKRKPGLLNK